MIRKFEPAAGAAILAGFVGGVVGTWAMNYVQRWWTLAVDGYPPHSAAGKHDARDWQERGEHQNSNELAANRIATAVTGRTLTRAQLPVAAAGIHYAFGGAMGALYGAFANSPNVRSLHGSLFGLSVWLAADEIAMPVLGLSASTTRRSAEKHAQSMVAHLSFGIVAELTRAVTLAKLSDGTL